MTTLFSGINMALQALLAQQQVTQVIEHNVANANTDGYRRQQAVLTAGLPYPSPALVSGRFSGQMGSGVMVDTIRRFNLEFFDGRYRRELGESKRWETEAGILQQLQTTLSETGTDGVVAKLDDFWQGWQKLSDDPSSSALRADLVEKSLALTDGLNWRASSLNRLQQDQDLAIQQSVNEINNIARQIAQLNAEISKVKAVGDAPNDLMDQRDALTDRLAEISGAVSYTQENGEVVISIGDTSSAHNLVVGDKTFNLITDTSSGLAQIRWEQDGQPFQAVRGELAGLFDARDRVIPESMDALNQLASRLAEEVNRVHRAGYGMNGSTGINFFTDAAGVYDPANPGAINALNITVNPAIKGTTNPAVAGDLNLIAAASVNNAPGDNTQAVAIVSLSEALLMNSGASTFNQYYTGKVGELGLEVSNSQTRAKDRKSVSDSLDALRESSAGVNLDEEAANLVKSQRAYQAASRLLTTMDDMLDRVINGMGRVGL